MCVCVCVWIVGVLGVRVVRGGRAVLAGHVDGRVGARAKGGLLRGREREHMEGVQVSGLR